MNASAPVVQPPASLFERIATWAAYLYLRRVPVLIGAVMALFPVIALWPARILLQNLFFLTPGATFWCTVATVVLAWSLLLTARLVLLNGSDRFGLPQQLWAVNLSTASVVKVTFLSLPILLAQFTPYAGFHYDSDAITKRTFAILGGIATAYLLAYTAIFFAVLLAPAGSQDAAYTFPAPRFMIDWLRWANAHEILPAWIPAVGRWIRDHLPRGLWIGYLNPKDGFLWGGHWLALLFTTATILLYLVIDIYTWQHMEKPAVSAITFVLLLLLNLNWIFSFFAFLLDRYRIPLVAPVILLITLGGLSPSSDHYYDARETYAGAKIPTVRPAEVLETRIRQKKPIVLVATAGGGIQAAAWTAQVLAGLQNQSTHWQNAAFADSVALISSVSGGATGSMFFMNLYHPGQPMDRQELAALPRVASEPGLDGVAWALVYRDVPRIFFPYMNVWREAKLLDRGYVLEQTWRKNGGVQAMLSDWRTGVVEGERPAVIFNSTITETGEPLAFATTDIAASGTAPRQRSFYEMLPGSDLPVVTAVRLAATFPYVTPAARSLPALGELNQPGRGYHLIDGGYYDNYGVSSLIEWLDEGFTALQQKSSPLPSDILVIQIRSFPPDPEPNPTRTGWLFQTYAPIAGLVSARTSAQLIRDQQQLDLFVRRWAKSSNSGDAGVRVHVASFVFPDDDAPLSWAMNSTQIQAISDKWNGMVTPPSRDLAQVHCFFEPNGSGCRTPATSESK